MLGNQKFRERFKESTGTPGSLWGRAVAIEEKQRLDQPPVGQPSEQLQEPSQKVPSQSKGRLRRAGLSLRAAATQFCAGSCGPILRLMGIFFLLWLAGGAFSFWTFDYYWTVAHSEWSHLWILLCYAVVGFVIFVFGVLRPIRMLSRALHIFDQAPDEALAALQKVPSGFSDPIKDGMERLFGRFGVERAESMRQILASQQLAQRIASVTDEGIWLVRGTEVVFANPVAQEIMQMGNSGVNPFSATSAGAESNAHPPFALEWVTDPRVRSVLVNAVLSATPGELEVVTRRGEPLSVRTFRILPQVLVSPGVPSQELGSGGTGLVHSGPEPEEPSGAQPDLQGREVLLIAQDVSLIRESDRARSIFLSHLAHEIRTPITSLTILLRLLGTESEDGPNREKQREWVALAASESDRLRVLVEELLATASRDTLFSPPAFKRFPVVPWLTRVLKRLATDEPGLRNELGVDASQLPPRAERWLAELDEAKFVAALSLLIRFVNAGRESPGGATLAFPIQFQVVNETPAAGRLELTFHGPSQWSLAPVLGMIRLLFEVQNCLVFVRDNLRFVISIPLTVAPEVEETETLDSRRISNV